jgi:hypothetical protein
MFDSHCQILETYVRLAETRFIGDKGISQQSVGGVLIYGNLRSAHRKDK